ncbi:MAG: autotransporter outer membrane beta-barrel domain-containing protein [Endozoicomonas sp.]
MKARSLLSPSAGLALASSLSGLFVASVIAAPEFHYDKDKQSATLTFTETKTVNVVSEIDVSTLYKAPQRDAYYFKVLNADPSIASGDIVPVKVISSPELVTGEQNSAAFSHPAVADWMNVDAAFHAYDSFTAITRSFLRGRIPAMALNSVPDDLHARTPAALMLTSTYDEEEDYVVEDDGNSYVEAVTDSARAFVSGTWLGFVQPYGHFLDQKKTDSMAGFKSTGYGVQGTLLKAVSDNWVIGVYGAWQQLKGDMRDTDGKVDTTTWRAGPTVAWGMGPFHAEGLVTYNWNTVDSKVRAYNGDYKSNQWDAYVRAGYDIAMDGMVMGLALTPEVQFLYSSQKRDDFNWAMGMVEGGKSSGWLSRAGATLSYDRMQFDQPLALKLSAGWQHNHFQTGDLEYQGEKHKSDYYDRNGAYYSAGLDTSLNERLNLTVGYAGVWSKNALSHYVQAGVEFRF